MVKQAPPQPRSLEPQATPASSCGQVEPGTSLLWRFNCLPARVARREGVAVKAFVNGCVNSPRKGSEGPSAFKVLPDQRILCSEAAFSRCLLPALSPGQAGRPAGKDLVIVCPRDVGAWSSGNRKRVFLAHCLPSGSHPGPRSSPNSSWSDPIPARSLESAGCRAPVGRGSPLRLPGAQRRPRLLKVTCGEPVET